MVNKFAFGNWPKNHLIVFIILFTVLISVHVNIYKYTSTCINLVIICELCINSSDKYILSGDNLPWYP